MGFKVRIEKRRVAAWAVTTEGSMGADKPTGTLHPITYALDAREQGECGGSFIEMPTREFDLFDLKTVFAAHGVSQVVLVAVGNDGRDLHVPDGRTKAGTVRVERVVGLDTDGVDNAAFWEECRAEAEGRPGDFFLELSEDAMRIAAVRKSGKGSV